MNLRQEQMKLRNCVTASLRSCFFTFDFVEFLLARHSSNK